MSSPEHAGSEGNSSREKSSNALPQATTRGQQSFPFSLTSPTQQTAPQNTTQTSAFSFGGASTLTPQQQTLLANALQFSVKVPAAPSARPQPAPSNNASSNFTSPIVTSPNAAYYYSGTTMEGTAFSSNDDSGDNYEDDEMSESVDGTASGTMDHLASAALGDGNSNASEGGVARFMDITPFLNMPQSQAAKRLGIPTSTLSKRWKEAVRNRKWPYRTISKLDKEIMTLLHNIPQPANPGDETVLPAEIEATLGHLLRKRLEELRSVVIRIN